MLASWPGEASRPIAGPGWPGATCGASRHIAVSRAIGEASCPLVSFLLGRARAVLPVSRLNGAGTERSGVEVPDQVWSQASCAGRTGLILGANRAAGFLGRRMSSKCQLCEAGAFPNTPNRSSALHVLGREAPPEVPAAIAALPITTIVRVAAIFPLPDTRARQEPLEGRDGLDCNERVRKDKASDARACVAKGPPCLALANPRRRPGARPARAEA